MAVGIVIVVALLVVVLGLPLVLPDMEQIDLNEETRAAMAGECFASLSDGVTHYEWVGPEDGTPVVLIHGFSTPMFVWDKSFGVLAEAGFRVLRYDLYGRGLSDRPMGEYGYDLFVRQLDELLDSQHVAEPVHVVGLSMGGSIAVHFADRRPERVRAMALFAPAGIGVAPRGPKMFRIPLLGPWLVRVLATPMLLRTAPNQFSADPAVAEAIRSRYAEQLRYRGYRRALVATLDAVPMAGQEAAYGRVGKQDRRGLLFWGTDDTVVPYALHARVRELIPFLDLYTIDGGGHGANYDHADEVNPVLIEFLKSPE